MSDKRTKGWFLVDSPKDVALVVSLYLLMVWLGPRLMKKKKPFNLKGVLIAYNFIMMLVNFLILKDLLVGSSRLNYKYLCHRSDLEFHPEEIRVMNAMWWFYISKALEFTDTLFFILRKKTDQLSLLHVYHHSTMFPICWSSIKWYPSGAAVRLPMLNCFVHVVMYFYYGLSAIGPSVKKMLWWKRYLTVLQLIQFVISLFWSLQSLIRGCNHPAWIDITSP
ncbi:elongation of very long chain fatty acids protein 4-like [Episyrphus balteatus]|uniref:elongation of very long chain fatty acids protein 4-like n=1 Tax=Episyrphus balteatus TaxID=286459 RepID=UPI0024859BB5|nr:elongation of very long chain fatty acids protein 4-like [Episyrphus balteatus]